MIDECQQTLLLSEITKKFVNLTRNDGHANFIYLSLRFRLVLVTADWVVGDVERMILGWRVWVVATFDHKRVSFASNEINFGYQESVDVPGNSPSDVT